MNVRTQENNVHERAEFRQPGFRMTLDNAVRWQQAVRYNAIGACASVVVALFVFCVIAGEARAERLENAVAVFAALDKVTARIKKLEVALNDTVQFGSLKLTPRVCYSRPPTEPPKTTSFVEITETELDGQEKKLFSGWMFAESPGLNAVEHPVFDVWLTGCDKPAGGETGDTAAAAGTSEDGIETEQPAAEPRRKPRRRRVRR